MDWVDRYDALATAVGDLAVLGELRLEGLATETEMQQEANLVEGKLRELERESQFSGRWDHCAAVLHVASENESYSSAWAYSQQREFPELKFRSDISIDRSDGFFVEGKFAFGQLKSLTGRHEVSHLNPYHHIDKLKPIHLEAIVFPLIPDLEDVFLPDKDLHWDRCRRDHSWGRSCCGSCYKEPVRVRHLPTGYVVEANEYYQMQQNEQLALQLLRSRLIFEGKIDNAMLDPFTRT